MTSLETETTEELWKELQSRFDACILIYEEPGATGPTTRSNMLWKGSWGHMLGLMEIAKDNINEAKLALTEEP